MILERDKLIGAFFFPQAHDNDRDARANTLGYPPTPLDLELARNPNSYRPPAVYSIDYDGQERDWVDTDPAAVRKQLALLLSSGVDVLCVDAYSGIDHGKPVCELKEPLDVIAREVQGTPMQFCTVMCIKRPRAVLPVPPGYDEPNRLFDLSLDTLNQMVAYSKHYWDNPNYLHIDGKPVLMIYGFVSSLLKELGKHMPKFILDGIGTWIKAEGSRDRKTDPYLIGIVDTPLMALDFIGRGFDLTTTMAGFPSFNHTSGAEALINMLHHVPPQAIHYLDALIARYGEWMRVSDLVPFIPSTSLGWDARPRADRRERRRHAYPVGPHLIENTPTNVSKSLEAMRLFFSTVTHSIATLPELYLIFAANEFGEGASLYPRVTSSGVDNRFLTAVHEFYRSLHQFEA